MDKTALVTGASGGIGLELARLIAQDGYSLILVARSIDKLKEIKSEFETNYGVDVEFFGLDLTLESSLGILQKYIDENNPIIDILVNNAGIGGYGSFLDRTEEQNDKMIDLNIKSLTHLTRMVLPGMVERRNGKILNLSSTAAFLPGPNQAVYFASKAYVLSLSQALDEELSGTGVSVTALCPGPVDTGFAKAGNLENAKLFKFANTPEKVAKRGYKALKRKKLVAFDSMLLRFVLKYLIYFVPGRLLLKASKKSMEA